MATFNRTSNRNDTLNGTSNTDVIDAGDGNNSVFSGAGDDVVTTGSGNDYVDSGAGNDVVFAGGGADFIVAGDGRDRIFAQAGDDSVFLSSQDGQGSLVDGGSGDDFISVAMYGAAHNTVIGGTGDDVIRLESSSLRGAADTTIALGEGRDRVEFAVGNLSEEGSGSKVITDFQIGLEGDVINLNGLVFFDSGQNPFKPSLKRMSLVQSGQDTLVQFNTNFFDAALSTNFVTVLTLQNVDVTALGPANFEINGREVNPLGSVTPAGVTRNGTAQANTLNGAAGDDTMAGNGGNDVMDGFAGNDNMTGGSGNDLMMGGNGDDFMSGDDGVDTLFGGVGNDLIYDLGTGGLVDGGVGRDMIYVQGSGFSVVGGQGDDFIDFQAQVGNSGVESTIEGGDGDDRLFVTMRANQSLVANLGDGDDQLEVYAPTETSSGLVRITTGSGRDVIRINGEVFFDPMYVPASVVIQDFQTGPGGDVVDVSRLVQTTGGISVVPNNTNPFSNGLLRFVQDGNNLRLEFDYDREGGLQAVTVLVLENTQLQNLTADNIAGFTGNSFNGEAGAGLGNSSAEGVFDVAQGTVLNDAIAGGDGDDSIDAGQGNDTVSGGLGNDLLRGGAGNDSLQGDYGADTLDGGDGDDTLRVAEFRDEPGQQVVLGGSGDDLIILNRDYSIDVEVDAGTGDDLIQVDTFSFNPPAGSTADIKLGAGVDTLKINGSLNGNFGDALVITDFQAGPDGDRIDLSNFNSFFDGDVFKAGYFRFVQNGSDAVLQGDLDGSAGPEGFADLVILKSVNAADLTEHNILASSVNSSGNGISIQGTVQNDQLQGGDANETIFGGHGDDVIRDGQGSNFIAGGTGQDSISSDTSTGSNTISGGDGDDVIFHSASAAGTSHLVQGDAGDDKMSIQLYGDANITVSGGEGTDSISLGGFFFSSTANNITVNLGGGVDTLAVDHTVVNTFTPGAANPIVVNDFLTGVDGDKFDITSVVNNIGAENNPFNLSNRYLRLVQSGSDTLLQTDLDGSGTAFAMQTYVVFKNTTATAFVRENMVASQLFGMPNYSPNGTALPASVMTTGNNSNQFIGGNANADSLDGAGGNDTLRGFSGADTLIGGLGNDSLQGEDGNDQLFGGEGADVLLGGSGNDFMLGEAGNDTLNGGAGLDYLDGGAGSNVLDGGDSADSLYATDGAGYDFNQTLIGGDGNDTVFATLAGPRAMTISAGAGDDVVNLFSGGGEFGAVNISLGAGVDTLSLDGNIHAVQAASAPVLINDFVTGSGGDRINLQAILATFSIDFNPFESGHLKLQQSGADTLLLLDPDGTEGALESKAVIRFLNTTASSFTFENFLNPSVNPSGEGISLVGTVLADILTGGLGADTLSGGTGNDNINSGAGNDLLQGGADTDYLLGEAGNDTLDGGAHQDFMYGGAGDDVYLVGNSSDIVGESNGEGVDTVLATATFALDTSSEVENLTLLGLEDINASGNQLNNIITGNAGANILAGGQGRDTIFGGEGRDTVHVNMTAESGHGDSVDGGGQFDRIILTADTPNDLDSLGVPVAKQIRITYSGSEVGNGDGSESQLIQLNDATRPYNRNQDGGFALRAQLEDAMGNRVGDTTRIADEGVDLVAGDFVTFDVRELLFPANRGDQFKRAVFGTEENDSVEGGATNDFMQMGAGNDTLVGGLGNDYLHGGLGNDSILGGEGNDNLRGAAGVDTVLGGSGDDRIVVVSGDETEPVDNQDSLDGGAGFDTLSVTVINYAPVSDDRLTGVEYVEVSAQRSTDFSLGRISANVNLGTQTESFSIGLFGLADTLISGSGNDTIQGTLGGQSIDGGAGSDLIFSLDGDDTLIGGVGDDFLVGGTGNDVYFADSALDITSEEAFSGVDTVNATVNYTLSANIENLNLTGGSASVGTGNDLGNLINGNFQANNSLYGLAGNDTLIAHEGNDFLDGGQGVDTMQGGNGNDTYQVDNAGDALIEAANAGVDTVLSTVSFQILNFIENLTLQGSENLNATGNILANVLTGNTGNNLIDGADGNDTLFGGAGSDTLQGGAGNDVLNGQSGADSMTGGSGDDTYQVDNLGDLVVELSGGGTGRDTVNAGITYTLGQNVENLTLTGNSDINGLGNELANLIRGNTAANILDGGTGSDTLQGLGGNDSLSGGTGSDSLDGGSGNDTLNGGGGLDTLVGGAGDDTFVLDPTTDVMVELAGEGIDTVISSISHVLADHFENLTLQGSANLFATGNSAGNHLSGNAGNNILKGLGGADTLDGSDGVDTADFSEQSGAIQIDLSTGTGVVSGAVLQLLNLEAVVGGAGNDSITGDGGNNTLDGGLGNDTLTGGNGDDTYQVNVGGDRVLEQANGGVDTVIATINYTLGNHVENLILTETSNRTGTGNLLNNHLTGNAGSNRLSGLGGSDTLVGEDGNDTLEGGVGADSMNGGNGNDTYMVDELGDLVFEFANQGRDTVISAIDYTLTNNLEVLVLEGGAISGTGNNLSNLITGNQLNNLLSGLAGNDTLEGGDGADTLNGGTGSDRMRGGAGNDVYFVDANGDVVIEFEGEGVDTMVSTITRALAEHVENLQLNGTAALSGTGNQLSNVIIGNDGKNLLAGLEGNDLLSGGANNDTLLGGSGDDTLTGGSGNDQFKFEGAPTSLGLDLIEDFTRGQDKINLQAIDASVLLTGDQAFNFVGSNAFTLGQAGQLRVQMSVDAGSPYLLQGDVNGDQIADFQIRVVASVALTVSDFIL